MLCNAATQRVALRSALCTRSRKYTLGIPLEFNLRVSPFYDTAYDMTGWGQGQYCTYLVPDWNSNLSGGMDDQYDPLLREYYVDILPKNFFIRVGRQIIS